MQMKKRGLSRGFTLLEILLAMAIMGVIAVFGLALANSVRNATKTGETQNRMAEIAAKAKAVYRNTETLPAGAGTGAEVPVGASDLNMEQKYRYDAWGTTLEYYRSLVSGSTILDIDYYTVDGKVAGGVLISLGPNQAQDYTTSGTPVDTYTTGGDDILIPIDVSQEAVEIALEELRVLQTKVAAFDALYEGMDNDGDGIVDDGNLTGCDVAAGGTSCPPVSGLTNDPNCGTMTLDQIENAPGSYGCSTQFTSAVNGALDLIIAYYSLGNISSDPTPGTYALDPWGNAYQWGCGSLCTTTWPQSDPHYHKFFSMGPDGAAGGGDDIIP